jgi:Raf kinase inhibitor-like YbhB/YbcL family protein
MELRSPAFSQGAGVPQLYTCKGRDASPPLEWVGAPAETRFFALVMDDPDAPVGLWTHWTWWDLPAHVVTLPEGADVERLGALQGTTTAKSVGYHGPCPPSGTHRYFFRLHALGSSLGLPRGADRAAFDKALRGKSLAEATLMGTFSK